MVNTEHLDWPFFESRHREVQRDISKFAAGADPGHVENDGVDAACRKIVAALGKGGVSAHVVPRAWGGVCDRVDVRTLCVIRETLARTSGLLDFSFAMQGLGATPIVLSGSDALCARYLPAIARGKCIAAFAISESEAGTDVAAMTTRARRDGGDWILDGEKTWISNAGIADVYVVFARTGDGARDIGAFVVDAGTPGMRVRDRIELSAPHPLGTLEFKGCRVAGTQVIGDGSDGFKIAMATLDTFRSSVGAAALGFARRALEETLAFARERRVFGERLADYQMTQARVADMAVEIDAAALLVYRAAWLRDSGRDRITREAAMAKLYATEMAQRVVDAAVQLHGGRGVVRGGIVESLYREIRPLRIYEGTSEIQKLIIARSLLTP